MVGLCGALLVVAAPVWTPVAAPAQAQPSCGPEGDITTLDSTPWPLQQFEMPSVWPLTRGDGVTVAVVDSGVSASHPVLEDSVLSGRDLDLPDNSGQCDEDGHGTLVGGIIAGAHDPESRFSGIAPEASVLPVRVLPDAETTTDQELPGRVAEAIRWSVDNGIDVINLSLTTVLTQDLAEAVVHAYDNDVVLVAAAGNVRDGEEEQTAYPAAFEEVIAVAGVDAAGEHVDTSVVGDYLTLAAPGADIEGPAPDGGYRSVPEGGTSYATAYVSGVVALLRARYPDMSGQEITDRLVLTADRAPTGHDPYVGYGVVNPYRALTTVLGSRENPELPPVVPPPATEDPLADQKQIVAWAAPLGLALAALVALSRPVLRRARRHGWRPMRVDRTTEQAQRAGPQAAGDDPDDGDSFAVPQRGVALDNPDRTPV